MRWVFVLLIQLFSPIIVFSASERIDSLRSVCSELVREHKFNEALIYGRAMIQLAECSDDEAARLTAFAYAAQSYLAADIYDTAYVYLGKGYDVWAEMKKDGLPESFYDDPYSVFTLYNSFAIYAANSTMNYQKVTEYLTEGLSLAKRYFPGDGYAVMGSNLVLSYFLREDPDGLKYALEIYEDGLKNRNNRLVYAGGFGAALMYCLLEDYSNAEYYIKQSLDSG